MGDDDVQAVLESLIAAAKGLAARNEDLSSRIGVLEKVTRPYPPTSPALQQRIIYGTAASDEVRKGVSRSALETARTDVLKIATNAAVPEFRRTEAAALLIRLDQALGNGYLPASQSLLQDLVNGD